MSFVNKFISEKEIEEQKELYDGVPKKQVEYDPRTLYEKLQEQKQKKEDELALKYKDKKERAESEKKRAELDEINRELLMFKKEQASLLVSNTNQNNTKKVEDEVIPEPVKPTNSKKNKLVNVKLVSTTKETEAETPSSKKQKVLTTPTTTASTDAPSPNKSSSLFSSYDSDSDNDSDSSDNNESKDKSKKEGGDIDVTKYGNDFQGRLSSFVRDLDHLHIVRVYEIFEHQPNVFMVIECRNDWTRLSDALTSDWKALRESRPLPIFEDLVRRLFQQLVSALDFFHSHIVLKHGDLVVAPIVQEKEHRKLSVESLLYDATTLSLAINPVDLYINTVSMHPYDYVSSCGEILYEMVYQEKFDPNTSFLLKPHLIISKECEDLISRILQPTTNQILTLEDVQKHPWFKIGLPTYLYHNNNHIKPGEVSKIEQLKKKALIDLIGEKKFQESQTGLLNPNLRLFDELRSLDCLKSIDYKSVVKRIKNNQSESVDNFEYLLRNLESGKTDINWYHLLQRVGLSNIRVDHLKRICESDPSKKRVVQYILVQIINAFAFLIDSSEENQKKSLNFTNYFLTIFDQHVDVPTLKHSIQSNSNPNKPKLSKEEPVLKLIGGAKRFVYSDSKDAMNQIANNVVGNLVKFRTGGASQTPIHIESNNKNAILLTEAKINQCGGFWMENPVLLKSGFICSFTFKIEKEAGKDSGADGFAFVIQPESNTAYDSLSVGSQKGYGRFKNCFAVEFDTWREKPNHFISLQSSSKNKDNSSGIPDISHSLTPRFMTNKIQVNLNDGNDHQVMIIYWRESLSVFVGGKSVFKCFDHDIHNDLIGSLEADKSKPVFIGVTGATGGSYQKQSIKSFTFNTYQPDLHIKSTGSILDLLDKAESNSISFVDTFRWINFKLLGDSTEVHNVFDPYVKFSRGAIWTKDLYDLRDGFVSRFKIGVNGSVKDNPFSFVLQPTNSKFIPNESQSFIIKFANDTISLYVNSQLNQESHYPAYSFKTPGGLLIDDNKDHEVVFKYSGMYITLQIDGFTVVDPLKFNIQKMLAYNTIYIGLTSLDSFEGVVMHAVGVGKSHQLKSFVNERFMIDNEVAKEIVSYELLNIIRYSNIHNIRSHFTGKHYQNTYFKTIEHLETWIGDNVEELYVMAQYGYLFSEETKSQILEKALEIHTEMVSTTILEILTRYIETSERDNFNKLSVYFTKIVWDTYSQKDLFDQPQLFNSLLKTTNAILSTNLTGIPNNVVKILFDSMKLCIDNPSSNKDYRESITQLIMQLLHKPSLVEMFKTFFKSMTFNEDNIKSIILVFPNTLPNDKESIQLLDEYSKLLYHFVGLDTNLQSSHYRFFYLQSPNISLMIRMKKIDGDNEESIDGQLELDLFKYSQILEGFQLTEDHLWYLIDIQLTFRYTLKDFTEILRILSVELKSKIDRLIQLEIVDTPLEYIRKMWIKSLKPFSSLEDSVLDQLKTFNYQTLDWLIKCITDEAKLQEFTKFLELLRYYKLDRFESDSLIISSINETNNIRQWKQSLAEYIINGYYLSISFEEHSHSQLFLEVKEKMAELLFIGDWSLSSIEPLIRKTLVDSKTIDPDLMKSMIRILHTIIDFKLSKDDCNNRFNTVSSFFKYPINYLADRIDDLVVDKYFVESYHKNIIQLIKEIKAHNPSLSIPKLMDQYHQCRIKIQTGKAVENQCLDQSSYSKLTLQDQISILVLSCQRSMNITIREIQLLSLILLIDKPQSSGRLLQINTGEGKSILIAMLAVHQALLGLQVDVITTTEELAKPQQLLAAPLFKSLGLSPQSITYSGICDFQRSVLDEHFKKGESNFTKGVGRFAIIDEADSMMLEGNDSIVMLSDATPGIDSLMPLLAATWAQLDQVDKRIAYSDEGELCYIIPVEHDSSGKVLPEDKQTYEFYPIKDKDPKVFIKELIEEHIRKLVRDQTGLDKMDITPERKKIDKDYPQLMIPNHLQSLVKESLISKWIDSALTAMYKMDVNKHYIIEDNIVKPVDAHNTLCKSLVGTQWRNGLLQFLQFKHGCKITAENLTTNFISNISFIKRYNNNMICLTGTLGGTNEKKLLEDLYKVDILVIPPFKNKQLIELEPVIVHDNDVNRWYNSIVYHTHSRLLSKRAVLIITKYICDVDELHKRLVGIVNQDKIKLFKYGNEPSIIDRKIEPGDVIISTTFASRALDINADQIEKYGGLHVCVTFLPESERVELQSYGRTSRTGNKGTCQLIVLDQEEHNTIDQLKLNRSESYEQKLKSSRVTIQQISKRDEIFSKFCKFKISMSTRYTAAGDHIVISALEERFAIWFRKYEDMSFDSIPYQDFENRLREELSKGKVITNPFYYVKLGNYFSDLGKHQDSYNQFSKAIEIEKNFVANAYYNRAHVILSMDKDRSWESNKSKPNPIDDLTKAKKIIEDNLEPMWMLLGQASESPLISKQIRNILYLFGMLKGSIEDMIGYHDYDRDHAILKKELERKGITDKDKEEINKQIKELTERRDRKGLIQSGNEHIQKVELISFNSLPQGENAQEFKDETTLFNTDGYMGYTQVINKQPEKKIQWGSVIGLIFIGVAQIVVGAVITVVTEGIGAPVGVALMAEGISDIITAVHEGIIERTFTWKQWGIEKAISLTVSVITAGTGSIKAVGKVAWTAGKKIFTMGAGKVLANASRKFAVRNLFKFGFKGVTTRILIKKTMYRAMRDQVIEYVLTQGLNYIYDQLFVPELIKFIKTQIRPIIETHFGGNSKLKGLLKSHVGLVSSRINSLIHTDEENSVFYRISTGIATGLIHSKSVKLSILFDILRGLKAVNDIRTMLPEFLSKADKEIDKIATEKPVDNFVDNAANAIIAHRLQELVNDSVNSIAMEISNQVKYYMVHPVSRRISSHIVTRTFKGDNERHQAELNAYYAAHIQHKIANGKLPLTPIEHLSPTQSKQFIDEQIKNVKGNGELGVVHFEALSGLLQQPIIVHDKNGDVTVYDNSGNGKPNNEHTPPIELQYIPPDKNNKSGHWIPKGESHDWKLPADKGGGGKNNCSLDAIIHCRERSGLSNDHNLAVLRDNLVKYLDSDKGRKSLANQAYYVKQLEATKKQWLYQGGARVKRGKKKRVLRTATKYNLSGRTMKVNLKRLRWNERYHSTGMGGLHELIPMNMRAKNGLCEKIMNRCDTPAKDLFMKFLIEGRLHTGAVFFLGTTTNNLVDGAMHSSNMKSVHSTESQADFHDILRKPIIDLHDTVVVKKRVADITHAEIQQTIKSVIDLQLKNTLSGATGNPAQHLHHSMTAAQRLQHNYFVAKERDFLKGMATRYGIVLDNPTPIIGPSPPPNTFVMDYTLP
ncbi:helicase [Heterostelium album PN500]|uniref:Helicase n=1 Tax=Heterostelium pallidum (strain ATCC 26659 / Pp 5 / PN500) TaxID=670386 RepID=D3AY87_HETP5|nr:helicase [Heterostelium album PN500]EFA85914.1 helicase [Heterostelium album PN500]|eukprot:XP_020438020.1 helicase [Heterostelium album PN500]